MVAPIAPIAWTALRVGAVAAAAWYINRRAQPMPKHAWRERALNDLPQGVDLTRDQNADETNTHGSARVTRRFRLGQGGALEIDIAGMGRLRVRRTD